MKQTNKEAKKKARQSRRGAIKTFCKSIKNTNKQTHLSCSVRRRLWGALQLRRTPAWLALQIAPPPDGRSVHLYVCASRAPACTCRLKCCLQPQHNAWLCRAAAKWPLLDASYRWPCRSVTPFSAIYTSPPPLAAPLTPLTPPADPIPISATLWPQGGTERRRGEGGLSRGPRRPGG